VWGGEGREELVLASPALAMAAVGTGEVPDLRDTGSRTAPALPHAGEVVRLQCSRPQAMVVWRLGRRKGREGRRCNDGGEKRRV
jgi:hypothetical protein